MYIYAVFKSIKSLLWILLAAYVLQLQVNPILLDSQAFNTIWELSGEEASDEGADESEGLIRPFNSKALNNHPVAEIKHQTLYGYYDLKYSRDIVAPPPK